ncbi:MAG: hypothetical protein JNL93_26560 [Pelomonas sp.]|nr:hypothetical protein [Roseateles sp.]
MNLLGFGYGKAQIFKIIHSGDEAVIRSRGLNSFSAHVHGARRSSWGEILHGMRIQCFTVKQ